MREERSLNLIADFKNGFADGWFFAVGEFYKEELDIKFTPRIEHGEKVWRWTQGRCFSFGDGDILYDTQKAYYVWSEAIKHIKVMCQIHRATPNKKNDIGNIIDGWVYFAISRPNAKKNSVEEFSHHKLTQNQFIDYLKTGVLGSIDHG
jgi:hypothetical protein